MKANAPKKLYITNDENRFSDKCYSASTEKYVDNDIEYVRTDAFIEKALAYLHDKFYFNNVFYGIVSTDFNAMEEMYDDFRKYMKGE